jgi:hypothetical protein
MLLVQGSLQKNNSVYSLLRFKHSQEELVDTVTKSSLEDLLYSLTGDTLIILNRIAMGKSNQEIVSWSKGWSFTETKIEKMILAAYVKLDFERSKPDLSVRDALCAFMAECKQAGLLTPPEPNTQINETKDAPTRIRTHKQSRPRQRVEVVFNGVDTNSKAFKETLYFNMKLIAKSRKIQLRHVALAIGCSAASLAGLRKGSLGMNIERLDVFARVLRVRPEFLARTTRIWSADLAQETEHSKDLRMSELETG